MANLQETGNDVSHYKVVQSSSADLETTVCEKTALRARRKRLCKRCQSLQIGKALDNIPAKTGTFINSLGKLDNVRHRQGCPLCDLIHAITVQGTGSRTSTARGYDLYLLPGNVICGLNYTGSHSPNKFGVAFGAFRSSQTKKLALKERTAAIAKGFIAPIPFERKSCQAFQVQIVSQEHAEFSKMREWIDECRQKHPSNCQPLKRDPIPGFKCIDVGTRLRVPVEVDDDYYTLSYVWAEAHGTDTSAHKDIPDHIPLPQPDTPQLIEDALVVVKRLGGRYLWVDKYCTAQDDPQQLKTQIHAMNKIYEGAQVTIVAAPARIAPPGIAAPGLPGVSRPRLQSQPAKLIGKHMFASSLPHVSDVVAQSAWVTRAWTYQETVLSKRCLLFTDLQVYFTCPCMVACESIHVSPSARQLFRQPQEVNNSPLKVISQKNIKYATPLRYFFENLQQYKSRDLTKKEDSLDAFRGLLAKAPFMNIWGVPIACSSQQGLSHDERTLCIGLARGLWWECPGDTVYDCLQLNEIYPSWSRCPEFPSWSWAGWSGPIRLHEDATSRSSANVECNEVDESHFDIRFNVQYASGDIGPLAEFARRLHLQEANVADSQQSRKEEIRLTHALYIWTVLHLVATRRGPDQDKHTICICECPINHQQCRQRHAAKPHRVRIFIDLLKAKDILLPIFPIFWGAVPLFRCKGSKTSSIACLLIDWKQEKQYESEVRGVVYLKDEVFLDSHRKEIRLCMMLNTCECMKKHYELCSSFGF